MPIFTRSYSKISSWAAFKARDRKTDTSNKVIRLGSSDGTTPQPKRMSLRIPLGDGTIESDRESDTTHMLELDFIGCLGEA